MKTKKRQKLCYNCEGDVDLDVIVCPFCAADLREEKPEQRNLLREDPSLHTKAQDSLYPPSSPPRVRQEELLQEEMIQSDEEDQKKSPYMPIFLLALGSQLLLLGVFMLFFSKDGVFTLKWDAHFWYFYVLSSIPLFIFGLKSLKLSE